MTRFAGTYAPDQKAIHDQVRASVGNRCIRCGHPQGDRMLTGTAAMDALATDQADRTKDRNGAPIVFVLQPCDARCTHPRDRKLRILTVHHLTGKKDDNRWFNLLALCQVCHLQIQAKVIPEVPYLWRHREWFVPYVCGFYAAYYGRQDITREEAMADPHRWLRMGQPWLYEEPASDTARDVHPKPTPE